MFDPEEEYSEISQLFDVYKEDTKQLDISHLYSACFYTKDKALIQQFKMRLFQNLA